IGEKFILNDTVLPTNRFDKSSLLKGKALYEVISFYNRKFLYLEDHMQRLQNSAKLGKLKIWLPPEEIAEKIESLLQLNNIDQGSVNTVLNFSKDTQFTAYINKPDYPNKEQYRQGVKALLFFAERKNPNIKLFDKDFRSEVGKIIRDNELFDLLLVDNNGFITEGSKSNLFFVHNNEIFTSPEKNVLPGITRKHILDLCKRLEITTRQEQIHFTMLNEMQAIFFTGTTTKVLPVRSVDDLKFQYNHPEIMRIMNAFEDEITLLTSQ
ncbi:MAG: aminotransferase class IV family protein, partial [Bacteroidales bacterium]|nr:aminotransferase class IV family protein [Bacteroidales bacterium]